MMGSVEFSIVLTVRCGTISFPSRPFSPSRTIHTADLEQPHLPVAVQHTLLVMVWQPLLQRRRLDVSVSGKCCMCEWSCGFSGKVALLGRILQLDCERLHV